MRCPVCKLELGVELLADEVVLSGDCRLQCGRRGGANPGQPESWGCPLGAGDVPREHPITGRSPRHLTVDGGGKATIAATNARQPAVQVLGREITLKGLTVTGGQFGIAVNRGATAIVENNTIEDAARSGLEVSQNSFARIINNTIRHNKHHGILVLGSASVHIGVLQTGDRSPQRNVIENNGRDGIMVLRSSTARIIGNILSGNGRHGVTVQQASHADVAGNVINGNGEHGIRVAGNSGVNSRTLRCVCSSSRIRPRHRMGDSGSGARSAPTSKDL